MNMHTERLIEKAASLLSAKFNTLIEVTTVEVLKEWERSLILRCTLNSPLDARYASVIIKEIKSSKTCGFSDWAGLYFVSLFPHEQNLAPQLLCGDMENSFFIMEDMGAGKTLDTILRGTDSSLTENLFLDLVTKTAKLHVLTIQREDEYQEIRDVFPVDTEHGRHYEFKRWNEGLKKVYKWFEAVDCSIHKDTGQCLSEINNIYLNPGPFLTFTHGDMAPSNNYVRDNQVYLLDFEYGDYRHALYDITCWYMLCPLPEKLALMLKEHYKKAVLSQLDITEAMFELHWNYLCAWRGVAMLSWIPQDILRENRPWVGEWTMREAVLSTVQRLAKVCANSRELSPLGESSVLLYQKLLALWCNSTGGILTGGEVDGNVDDYIPKWTSLQR